MKTKLFLDTNVVFDLLGERDPFYDAAASIVTLADEGKISLIVSALTYATVFYLLSKFEDKEDVKEKIRKLKTIAETSDLTDEILEKGLSSKFKDFEDSLQYYCAVKKKCEILITRNGNDFKASDILVLSPDEYLNYLRLH